MHIFAQFIDIFLHLDVHLSAVIAQYGVWTYLILFVIIFCETGLVVTPFLPGDSLLFAAGTFAALGSLDVWMLTALLSAAAILGNMTNYQIGRIIGPKALSRENSRIFRKEYLQKTERYFERYGALTIALSRFAPIVRTFAPFMAGVGRMRYMKFAAYNFAGGLAWVLAFIFGGYFFGNIPFVRKNFTMVIMVIVLISLMPTALEVVRHRREAARQRA